MIVVSPATITVRRDSPLCGDVIDVSISIDRDRVVSTSHHARACSLTVASARIIDAVVPGRSVDDVRGLAGIVERAVRGGDALPDGFDAIAMVRVMPSRKACVLLPWHAVLDALAVPSSR